ncbi:MAG: ferredoxin [Verrucomicrobiales bacterium]|jgi:ferredoxin
MTQPRRLQVQSDVTLCVGARQCVLSDPSVFGHDEQHMVEVLQLEVDDHPELAEAIGMCPTGALWALDANTGEEIYP